MRRKRITENTNTVLSMINYRQSTLCKRWLNGNKTCYRRKLLPNLVLQVQFGSLKTGKSVFSVTLTTLNRSWITWQEMTKTLPLLTGQLWLFLLHGVFFVPDFSVLSENQNYYWSFFEVLFHGVGSFMKTTFISCHS